MEHTIGISNSYYKPSEREILDDYLKAINILTINENNNNAIIEKEIKELKVKNENNEYLIQSKLQERDDAIVNL
jgi:formylmethanofuran dehydrogenase subunit D